MINMSATDDLWNDTDDEDFEQERSQIMHPTVVVDKIPATINNAGLYNIFSKFGTVLNVYSLPSKKIPNTTIGFVTYNSMNSAQKAIQNMDSTPPLFLKVKIKLPKVEGGPFVR